MRIFISHSRKEFDLVTTLSADLQALGHEVWFDREPLGTNGPKWWDSILLNIRKCDLFIFALTSASLASETSRSEARYSASLNQRILPVTLSTVTAPVLPTELSKLPPVNYADHSKAQGLALAATLTNLPAPSALPDPLPPQPEEPVAPLTRIAAALNKPLLSSTEQVQLASELEVLFNDPASQASARPLLLKLGDRGDTVPTVVDKIQAILVARPRAAGTSTTSRVALVAALIVVVVVVGFLLQRLAGNGGTGNGGKNGIIAVLLPDSASSARWEADDRRFFDLAFKAAGVQYTIVNALGDKSAQVTQAEAALANGAKVILLVDLDAGSGATIIDEAHKGGAKVIDYDRLTIQGPGADFYVSFDNKAVGVLQGQGLVSAITAAGLKKPVQVAELNGSPTDNNATLFASGYDSVLAPLYKSGDYVKVDDQSVPDWDNGKAQTIFEQMLTAAHGKIDAAIAANDGLAGGVNAALANQGLSPIPLTGQDATVGGVQYILAGKQSMTVYKGIKAEADAAAALAVAVLNGADTKSLVTGQVNNGTNDIASVLLTPVSVTKDNIATTVIADGFRTWAEICVGDFAQYCPPGAK